METVGEVEYSLIIWSKKVIIRLVSAHDEAHNIIIGRTAEVMLCFHYSLHMHILLRRGTLSLIHSLRMSILIDMPIRERLWLLVLRG